MNGIKRRLVFSLVMAVFLPMAFASSSNAGVFISKTSNSYLRITLNEKRKPVRVEGVFPLRCDGGFRGTSSIDLKGAQIKRYRDGSFGYVYKSDRNIRVRKKFRAKLSGGKIKGFFSYRDERGSRCWSGRSYSRSAVRFAASRRDLKLSTYVFNDGDNFFRFTLTDTGRPIRLEGRFPIRCNSDGETQEKSFYAFLPRDFKYSSDGSFRIGQPLAENYNSLLQGLEARLVDGAVIGSYWYRFRISTEPETEDSCYSGDSDLNPTVDFAASRT